MSLGWVAPLTKMQQAEGRPRRQEEQAARNPQQTGEQAGNQACIESTLDSQNRTPAIKHSMPTLAPCSAHAAHHPPLQEGASETLWQRSTHTVCLR